MIQQTADNTPPEETSGQDPVPGVVIAYSPQEDLIGQEHGCDPALTLGRVAGGDVSLVVADPAMSRRHVRLFASGRAIHVADLGSRNGTVVDGRKLAGEVRLLPGSVVRAGSTLLVVVMLPPGLRGPDGGTAGGPLTGRSPALRAVLRELDRVATSTLPVLLQGETGSGKELLAGRLHERSGRSGALVAVNCAAIPRGLLESTMFGHRKGAFTGAVADAEGLFAQADGGTLFLDEIGELSPELQPKLLRALDAGEVTPVGGSRPQRRDVRVVCATNADLAAKVEEGSFRRDLYARLSGLVVEVPPLRARRSDIPLLARHFLAAAGAAPRLGADFLEPLLLAPWSMNVRELRLVMQRAVLLAGDGHVLTGAHARGALGAEGLPVTLVPDDPTENAGDAPPREELEALLSQAGGNVARLAGHYGKDRKQVYRWLKRRGIDPGAYRA
jgi:transcriptional regulator with GAF, ATPase, and Fis domain